MSHEPWSDDEEDDPIPEEDLRPPRHWQPSRPRQSYLVTAPEIDAFIAEAFSPKRPPPRKVDPPPNAVPDGRFGIDDGFDDDAEEDPDA